MMQNLYGLVALGARHGMYTHERSWVQCAGLGPRQNVMLGVRIMGEPLVEAVEATRGRNQKLDHRPHGRWIPPSSSCASDASFW